MSAPTQRPIHMANPATRDKYFYGWRYVERTREDGSVFQEQVPLTEWDVLHPQEDDFIMQNEPHVDVFVRLREIFRWRLAKTPGALVLTDHRIDFQVPGLAPLGPDVAVFANAPPWADKTGTFPVRDSGATPLLVVEVTSPATRRADIHEKVNLYDLAGVPLYVIVDMGPSLTKIDLTLQAYRHTAAGPVHVPLDEMNRLWLPPLDLALAVEGDQLVLLDENGNPIGDYIATANAAAEAARQANEEQQRADAEKARADEASRKVRELEDELRRLRGNP